MLIYFWTCLYFFGHAHIFCLTFLYFFGHAYIFLDMLIFFWTCLYIFGHAYIFFWTVLIHMAFRRYYLCKPEGNIYRANKRNTDTVNTPHHNVCIGSQFCQKSSNFEEAYIKNGNRFKNNSNRFFIRVSLYNF